MKNNSNSRLDFDNADKEKSIEELNKDLSATILKFITRPSNLEITWAFFGEGLSYSKKCEKELLNSKYHLLINNIEADAQELLANQTIEADFLSYKDAAKSLRDIIYDFVINVRDKEPYKIKGENVDMFLGAVIIITREAALIAYEKGHYSLAMELYDNCNSHFLLVREVKRKPHLLKYEMSKLNKKTANSRWSKHNRKRAKKKRQYLNIMREQKFTTFADTATYIKQHIDTDSKPSHDTIKRWLSQANKGDFS